MSLLRLKVKEWLSIPGRGIVALCDSPQGRNVLVGEKVLLDGELYRVSSIEMSSASKSDIGLVVTRVLDSTPTA